MKWWMTILIGVLIGTAIGDVIVRIQMNERLTALEEVVWPPEAMK